MDTNGNNLSNSLFSRLSCQTVSAFFRPPSGGRSTPFRNSFLIHTERNLESVAASSASALGDRVRESSRQIVGHLQVRSRKGSGMRASFRSFRHFRNKTINLSGLFNLRNALLPGYYNSFRKFWGFSRLQLARILLQSSLRSRSVLEVLSLLRRNDGLRRRRKASISGPSRFSHLPDRQVKYLWNTHKTPAFERAPQSI